MADLKNKLSVRGEFGELGRVRGSFRDRLLDQEMLAALQEHARDLEMAARRRCDRSRVHEVREFLQRSRRS